MDGIERAVVVANNSIPGPPIIVYQGQWVIIHVTNHLLSESVTVHWHGIHQRGTPYSDGVAFISQCPVMPGQLFSYKFKVCPLIANFTDFSFTYRKYHHNTTIKKNWNWQVL